MRCNANTKILGARVVLVPYEAAHVPTYHEWMKDEEIQRLTASEPLSLDEEYAMQRSWREDDDKCTFIVLDAALVASGKDEVSCMVGDVNLFIERNEQSSAECEIMIAEQGARGKGFGQEAMSLMIGYAAQNLKIDKFFARITEDNAKSIAMFEKLGFCKVSHSSVFHEHTLELLKDKQSDFVKYFENARLMSYRDD